MSPQRRPHPWRRLRDHYPHLHVHFTDLSRRGRLGRLTGRGIEIERTSNQKERRETLLHELHHYERGPAPKHPYFGPLEERIVDRLTAEELISLDALVDALTWSHGHVNDDVAEELWVTLDTLITRVRNLTEKERTYIREELARRQPWNN
ncbi:MULTISPECIES: hypothetical protein [unclassified Rhodococcus (in: high G+C Gram-positive bacteria)]|uniref:hypothetical protein n=1 Tax=unclassified Rhodococcus (in: high G+C Gram-positive bacteria) TaxID=192944 RepID=UPI00092BE017|nr:MULTISPECIES: hypothetical protein [unclassified Rhodococcus (in: high G+C Gram-positive bacteria)]MCZ1070779.1 hypothetical protein [Rhodococcus sp. A5(2022)]OLL21217.1 hypothetical protein BKE56_015515 [Rhodococcus sp. M8]